MCYEVTPCKQNESYNYLTNKCSLVSQNLNNFPSVNLNSTNITNNSSSISNSGKINPVIYIFNFKPTINCVNGYFPTNSTICLCYKGWTDSNDNLENGSVNYTIQKCNRVLDGFSNSSQNNSSNNQTVTSTYNSSSYPIDPIDVTQTSTSSTVKLKILVKKFNIIIIVCSCVCFLCLVSCIVFFYCKFKAPSMKSHNHPMVYLPKINNTNQQYITPKPQDKDLNSNIYLNHGTSNPNPSTTNISKIYLKSKTPIRVRTLPNYEKERDVIINLDQSFIEENPEAPYRWNNRCNTTNVHKKLEFYTPKRPRHSNSYYNTNNYDTISVHQDPTIINSLEHSINQSEYSYCDSRDVSFSKQPTTPNRRVNTYTYTTPPARKRSVEFYSENGRDFNTENPVYKKKATLHPKNSRVIYTTPSRSLSSGRH